MENFKMEYQTKENYIKTLEQQVQSLENELAEMKADKDKQEKQVQKLEQQIHDDKQETRTVTPAIGIPIETQKTIAKAIMDIDNIRKVYLDAINPILKTMTELELMKRDNAENEKQSDDDNSSDE
jgi:DNA repair exonuclease SbcCD ATPase subunit